MLITLQVVISLISSPVLMITLRRSYLIFLSSSSSSSSEMMWINSLSYGSRYGIIKQKVVSRR